MVIMRELRVEDALMYLDQVKMEYGNRPQIYNEFLHIMKTFKMQEIDTPGVIMRVTQLFRGNTSLILGFNTFLPEGFKIEIPADGSNTVYYYAPGQVGVTPIHPNGPPPGPLPGAGPVPVPGPPHEPPRKQPPQHMQEQMSMQGMIKQEPNQHQISDPASNAVGNMPNSQQQQMQKIPGQMPNQGQVQGQGQQLQEDQQNHVLPNGSMQRPSQNVAPAPAQQSGFAQQNQQQHMQHMQQQQQQHMPIHLQQQPGRSGQSSQGNGSGGAQGNLQPMGQQGRNSLHHPQQQPAQQNVNVNVMSNQKQQQMQGPGPMGALGGAGGVGAGPGEMQVMTQQNVTPPPGGALGQQHVREQQQQAQQQHNASAQQPPVEFDHAINYVTTIKRRFASEPDTYKKFLEILHTYQKEQRGIKEVLDEVSVLFADHPDLLKDFTYFLPDAVQEQAKLQLAHAVRQAETRRSAINSRKAIMDQARQQRPIPPTPEPPMRDRREEPVYLPMQTPIPFGAKEGRTEEREREICRSVIYGVVSFDPVRPPRKHELTPGQAAAKYGRPRSVPEIIVQPTTKEASFFERAKEHLNRKELGPDKAPGSRRHTPHTEFLKCLHLFGAGILSKHDLLLLLKTLFMQGHAPKSGANASGGINNQHIATAANQLLKEFAELLVSRGPYARQQSSLKDKSKYGALTCRECDVELCEEISPSYHTYPSDYPYEEFYTHSGQTEEDASVLNTTVVCVRNAKNVLSSKLRLLDSLEEYDGVRSRRNVFEEAMSKVEDERFEVDLAIETNSSAMRQVEPLAEEVNLLRDNEEREGQPIGRLHYELRPQSLHSNHIGAIARLYSEQGDEVIHHLMRNPISVLPIVFKRLREKDIEWREVRIELLKQWRLICETNYESSLDVTCYFNRREIERSFTADQLIEACKRARHYVKKPKELQPALKAVGATYSASHSDPSMLLFQSHLSVRASADMPHKDVYECLAFQVLKSAAKTNADREKTSRIWTEFLTPWFDIPTHWILKELRDKSRSEKSSCIVKYAPGQMVRTAFGDGRILAYNEAAPSLGAHYKIDLPFGTGYIRPSSIVHHLPPTEQIQYCRRGGFMELIEAADEPMNGGDVKKLRSSCRLVFGTEKVYIFMRLYCALIALFESAKTRMDLKSYHGFVDALKSYINENIQFKAYELRCRAATKDKCYELSAIPRLIEKCADALVKVAKEDKLLRLFDFYQLKHMDFVLQRTQSLNFNDEAAYRIQYDPSDGKVQFSYLARDKDMLTAPRNSNGSLTSATSYSGGEPDKEDHGVEDGEVVDRNARRNCDGPQNKRVRLV